MSKRYITARIALALSIFSALLGSTAPSPLYPLFMEELGLSQSMATVIFAIYALGTFTALMLAPKVLRSVPDARWLLVPGLALTGLGAFIFASSTSVSMLLAGRFLNGAGTGIITGLASAALYELAPVESRKFAAVVATLAFTGGAAGGPLLTATALSLDFYPFATPFVAITLLAALALVLLLTVPWPRQDKPIVIPAEDPSWRYATQEPVPPRTPALFRLACLTVAIAWMLGSALMALGANISLEVFGLASASLAGLIPSIFQVFAGLGQVLWGRISSLKSVLVGVLGLAAAQIALAFAAPGSHWGLLLLIMPLYGFFYGAAFVGALALASASAKPGERAAYLSRFYIVGYLSNALPTLGLGVMADQIGLAESFYVFSVVITCLAVVAAVWAQRKLSQLAQSHHSKSACPA